MGYILFRRSGGTGSTGGGGGTPGEQAIDSVFGRVGVIEALPGDYKASQVENDSSIVGLFVRDALDWVAARLAGMAPGAAALTTTQAGLQVSVPSSTRGTMSTAARADHNHSVLVGLPISIGLTNEQGDAPSLARSNHQHAHGDLPGGTLHEAATTLSPGFMTASDKQVLVALEAATAQAIHASDVLNDSSVSGTHVRAALETLSMFLAAKADQSALTAGLATKADQSALTAGLATKADQSALTAGLATKADQTAVDAALALKANQSAVDTALATKADQSALILGLATKADQSALEAGLAGKASTNDWVNAGPGLTGGGPIGSSPMLAVGEINDAQHGVRGGGNLHGLATETTHGFMAATDKQALAAVVAAVEGGATGGGGGTEVPLAITAPPPVAASSQKGESLTAAHGDHTHAGVVSFLGRQGEVLAGQDDYAASGVRNDSSVGGLAVSGALDTLQSQKADQSALTAGLAGKADQSALDAGLAGKADQATVDAGLATKADQATVDAELATKADQATVDAGLAGKADQSALDAGLAGKADQSALTAGLATKADRTNTVNAGSGLIGGGQIDNNPTLAIGEITDLHHGQRSGGLLHAEVTDTTPGFMTPAHLQLLNDVSAQTLDVFHPNPDGVITEPIGAASSDGDDPYAARADHVHEHGDQAGGTLHALATDVQHGFLSATDKSWLNDPFGWSGESARTKTVGDTNKDGGNSRAARVDHQHAHGDQPGGTLHAEATWQDSGFMSTADKFFLDTSVERYRDGDVRDEIAGRIVVLNDTGYIDESLLKPAGVPGEEGVEARIFWFSQDERDAKQQEYLDFTHDLNDWLVLIEIYDEERNLVATLPFDHPSQSLGAYAQIISQDVVRVWFGSAATDPKPNPLPVLPGYWGLVVAKAGVPDEGGGTGGAVGVPLSNVIPPAVGVGSAGDVLSVEAARGNHTHAGVTSFVGRQGVLVAELGDYTGDTVGNVAASSLVPGATLSAALATLKGGQDTLQTAIGGKANIGSGVTSWASRTGDVGPLPNDYSGDTVKNEAANSGVAGATLSAALSNLVSIVNAKPDAGAVVSSYAGRQGVVVPLSGDYTSDTVTNMPSSTVAGATLSIALANLVTSLSSKANGSNTVNAGSGLTGGGALSTNPSLAVGVINDTQHGNRGGGLLHPVANAGAAGFLSSADWTKLSGIASGATNTPAPPTAGAAPLDLADTVAVAGAAGVYATGTHVHAHGNRGGGALHAVASGSAAGFLSAADWTKLSGIASGATNTPAPPTAGATPLDLADTVAVAGAAGVYATGTHVHAHGNRGGGALHAEANGSAAGFFSAADWTKLSGIAAGATNTAAPPTPGSTPLELADTTADPGVAGVYARGTHVHAHGNRGGGALHALAAIDQRWDPTQLTNGFLSGVDAAQLAFNAAPAPSGPLVRWWAAGDTVYPETKNYSTTTTGMSPSAIVAGVSGVIPALALPRTRYLTTVGAYNWVQLMGPAELGYATGIRWSARIKFIGLTYSPLMHVFAGLCDPNGGGPASGSGASGIMSQRRGLCGFWFDPSVGTLKALTTVSGAYTCPPTDIANSQSDVITTSARTRCQNGLDLMITFTTAPTIIFSYRRIDINPILETDWHNIVTNHPNQPTAGVNMAPVFYISAGAEGATGPAEFDLYSSAVKHAF